MSSLELYGRQSCPYTQELREWLEWNGAKFVEWDVELDTEARARLRELGSAPYIVPLLVRDGKVVQVGWQGRGCPVNRK